MQITPAHVVFFAMASMVFLAIVWWLFERLILIPFINSRGRMVAGGDDASTFVGNYAVPAPRNLALPGDEAEAQPVFPLPSLVHARHVLIIGQSGAGKTVLSHAIASIRAKRKQRVLVCDPDARPGMWPGCEVVGGGDDFSAVESTLQAVQQEVEQRRQARAEGQRDFPPFTLVMSEASDIIAECPTARVLFESMLRRARKLNASLLVDVQDDQVRTLDIRGASKLKVNFSAVVEMRLTSDGRRVARVNGEDYPVPRLPDPENLADEYIRRNPDAAIGKGMWGTPPTVFAPMQTASVQPQWTDKHRTVLHLLVQDPTVSIRAVARTLYEGNSGGEYSRMTKDIMREVVDMTGFRSQALDEIDGVQCAENQSKNGVQCIRTG